MFLIIHCSFLARIPYFGAIKAVLPILAAAFKLHWLRGWECDLNCDCDWARKDVPAAGRFN